MIGMQKLRLLAEKSKPLRPLYIQLLFVVLAFALLVGSSYLYAGGIVRKHLRAEMESTLSHVESQLFFELKEIETMLGVVSENMREMLLRGAGLEEAEAYIRDITVYGHEVAHITGLMNIAAYFDIFGGMVYNPAYDIPGFEFRGGGDFVASSRPWYKAAVEANGKTAATDAYVDAATGDVTLTYAREIFDADNNRIAIVSVDVSLDTIHEVSFSVHGTDGNYWALLDNNLIVIAHPDADLVGMHVGGLESGMADIAVEIERGDDIVERSIINYKGEESVITIRQIKNGWHLVVNTPIESYYADMWAMQRGLVGMGFALAAILCAILISITVKKNKAEKQIHEADRYRQALLESMETMIVITGLEDDKIIYMNERMKETFGFDDSIVGDVCWKHFNQDMDGRCGICPKRNPEFSGKPYSWELHSSDMNRDFRIISSIIDWPDGSKVFLEQVDDITELKAAIAEKDSLVNLSNTLNGMDATIFVTDPNTDEILFINDALIRVLGLESDVVGQKCYAALRGNSERCDFCPLAKLDEDPERKVVWDETNPETNRTYQHTSGYIKWLNGRTVYLQYTVDITELREMTNILDKRLEQLIAAKEFAEQSSRYKSAFLANMSHEIRTPMNAILGITEMQLQNEALLPQTEEALGKIYESGNLLLNIINDILDLSKIEAGKLEVLPVKYDIPSLINDVVQLTSLRYESKPLKFNLELDKDTPINLIGDELRIKQVLNNILSNAFKYTEKGTVSLSVFPEAQKDDGKVVIVFRIGDTGQGMTPEQLGTLFDEYTRFNIEANRTTIGTGLGMGITKRLLDLMDGEIFVESEVGKGSVFTVRIPQKRVDQAVCGPEI
ncbi:MAG: ATP-binding protein, partial [Oscillospiraceae bacterium]|nr:ATP-binding protein [Oscillospiraceae bacterium]